ncbi:MAG: DnaJ domain-containing protein [Flavobacteriales bacterium]|nr:DnaJ domain-containing protein [Flavobacteriales bacterium]
MRINYYELLGISSDASDADIKKAYRKVAMKMHPDVNPSPEANRLFAEINLAYETLIDTNKRFNYDYFRKYGRMPGTNPKTPPGPAAPKYNTTGQPPRYKEGPLREKMVASRNPVVIKSFLICLLFLGFLFLTLPVRAVISGVWDPVFIFVMLPGFVLVRDAWNSLNV